MDQIVGEILGRALVELVCLTVGAALKSAGRDRSSRNSKVRKPAKPQSSPTATLPPTHHGRAVLISSSTITFGNECERLVNIAFQTSQTFAGMMNTYADVSQYIRKELGQHYPDTHFHIIIGENRSFGFSVDDGEYFAEIEQERYRVLIFSSKQNSQTKLDHHDADSRVMLNWK